MKALVSAASKHGGTSEIAEAIADAIRTTGMEVEVLDPAQVHEVDSYDAVILGSGVYAGHWLAPANELVDRLRVELGGRPVWLFSSGPLGEPLKPEGDPVDVARLVERCGARGHRVFAGRLDRSRLGFGERAICAALRVPDGDFRPWPEIRTWALDIAAAVEAGVGGGWERSPVPAG